MGCWHPRQRRGFMFRLTFLFAFGIVYSQGKVDSLPNLIWKVETDLYGPLQGQGFSILFSKSGFEKMAFELGATYVYSDYSNLIGISIGESFYFKKAYHGLSLTSAVAITPLKLSYTGVLSDN